MFTKPEPEKLQSIAAKLALLYMRKLDTADLSPEVFAATYGELWFRMFRTLEAGSYASNRTSDS